MSDELSVLSRYTVEQKDLVFAHLLRRTQEAPKTSGLGIVFDLTYWCNLHCRGCGVCAKKTDLPKMSDDQLETSTEEIVTVLSKIKDYLVENEITDFFINFSGGEPFLRPDIIDILCLANDLFGRESIGIDTNGIIVTNEDLESLAPLVSCLGISIDGFKQYHDWWRRNSSDENESAFEKAMSTIRSAANMPSLVRLLEVSSVATTRNMDELPRLLEYLASLGVKKYSVHRAMAVGRLAQYPRMIPSNTDYLDLLVQLVMANKQVEIDMHIHHSIESIYATLFLGADTYAGRRIGEPDKRSSIGIDPKGKVFFDPWCMVSPWNQLCGGSLLTDGTTLSSIFEQDILSIASEYSSPDIRCNGCAEKCSGGSRIAAAASALQNQESSPTVTSILTGMTSQDPACLLNSEGVQC